MGEMMLKQGVNADEDAAHAFKVFDRDGDGLITAEELRLTMNNLGEPLTEAELNAMIAEADTDGDGKINFEEFKNFIINYTRWPRKQFSLALCLLCGNNMYNFKQSKLFSSPPILFHLHIQFDCSLNPNITI